MRAARASPPLRGGGWRGVFALAFATLATATIAAPVKIGVGAPLTGPDSIFGLQLRQGAELAVADANAVGGILGQRAQVVAKDDGGDPKKGIDVAKAFVAAKVPFVVGHFSSAVTLPASAIYAEAGMIDITPSATAPLVTDRDLATMFRTCDRADQQAAVAAKYLLARQFAKIAIVHDRTSNGKELADAVRAALAAAGRKDVFYGSFDKGARDPSAVVARLKASGAQIVFWGGGGGEAGLIAKQIRDANAKIVMMGGLAMATEDFAGNAGAAADGSLMVFPQDPRTRPDAADLVKRLSVDGRGPDVYLFYAYAAVQVLRQAAEAAHSLEPKKLAETMHSGMTFKTVVGSFTYDARGDPLPSDLAVYTWHKGATGKMTFDDLAKS